MMNNSAPLTGDTLDVFSRRLAAASPLHARPITEHGVEASPLPTPDFFDRVAVFHVLIPIRRRPIEMSVADVGDEVVVLGSPDRVDELARTIGLHLESTDDVVEYLRFWCRTALGRSEQLVEGPVDFHWISGVETDAGLRANADRAARLARWVAVRGAVADVYPAAVTVLDQRTLQLRELSVRADGHVEELSRVDLATDVPVPYTMP